MIPCLFIAYNRIEYTKQALQSLIASDVDEIFIWDNNSTDGTREYVLEAYIKHPKIAKVNVNLTNEGIAPAMNWFIKETKDYEFVCKVDNDTLIPKDFCKRMLPHMEKADLVQAKHNILKATHPHGFDQWVKTMKQDGPLRFHHFVGGSGVMMRRKVLSQLPKTEWLLYSWTQFQKDNPKIIKAFATDVEIELLDTDSNGANYPKELESYYKETKRIS